MILHFLQRRVDNDDRMGAGVWMQKRTAWEYKFVLNPEVVVFPR